MQIAGDAEEGVVFDWCICFGCSHTRSYTRRYPHDTGKRKTCCRYRRIWSKSCENKNIISQALPCSRNNDIITNRRLNDMIDFCLKAGFVD